MKGTSAEDHIVEMLSALELGRVMLLSESDPIGLFQSVMGAEDTGH